MKLIIGNKNLSSWSLRPWFAMKAFEIPFEEIKIILDRPNTTAEILKYSPSGNVPCLIDGDLVLPESLAILEYLNEKFHDRQMWPQDMKNRAWARSVSSEMLSGFLTLRTLMPHKVVDRFPSFDSSKARKDIERIEAIWLECRQAHRHLGPYLFGHFSIADAMYAPVVNRFRTYDVSVSKHTQEYMQTLLRHPSMKEWELGAVEELKEAKE